MPGVAPGEGVGRLGTSRRLRGCSHPTEEEEVAARVEGVEPSTPGFKGPAARRCYPNGAGRGNRTRFPGVEAQYAANTSVLHVEREMGIEPT